MQNFEASLRISGNLVRSISFPGNAPALMWDPKITLLYRHFQLPGYHTWVVGTTQEGIRKPFGIGIPRAGHGNMAQWMRYDVKILGVSELEQGHTSFISSGLPAWVVGILHG